MGSGGQPKQVLLNPFNIEDQRTLMGALALHQLNEVQAVLCHDVDFISGMTDSPHSLKVSAAFLLRASALTSA